MGKPVNRPELDFSFKSYIPEILRGIKVTNRHFWRNLVGQKDIVTVQYPEVKRPYPPRLRGRHRLMKRDDGQVRCVACMLCATACPSNCIEIVAGEHEDKGIEKYPVSFKIDLLTCIFCGNCEEACPCDAIRLDTGIHAPPFTTREEHVVNKEHLLERGGLSVAKQGGIL